MRRHSKIGLDTSVFIFQVERNEKYLDIVAPIFMWLESPRAQAVTSTITMLELLVLPYRAADIDRVNMFYALLSTFPHLEWVAPSLRIADIGAQLRAEHRLRTPDALQAATAISRNATGFVSNDSAFRRVAGLEVIVLDDLLIE